MHGVRILRPLVVGGTLATLSVLRFTAPVKARAADPTFAEDVAPILYKNCTVCHHDGGMAPFSLVSYDTAVAHTDEIRDAVAQRVMPPWHSTDPHGVFSNDRRLSDDERNTILRWIDAGAKPGDLHKLPPKPEYPAGWTFGTPDLVLSMADEFTVPASGKIDYQFFQVRVDIPRDRWVQAIEIMPGAREVVHHCVQQPDAAKRSEVKPRRCCHECSSDQGECTDRAVGVNSMVLRFANSKCPKLLRVNFSDDSD